MIQDTILEDRFQDTWYEICQDFFISLHPATLNNHNMTISDNNSTTNINNVMIKESNSIKTLSKSYYEEIMQFFDKLAPSTDNIDIITNDSTIELLRSKDDVHSTLYSLIQQDPSSWYTLNDIRNEARKKYHYQKAQERKIRLIKLFKNESNLEINKQRKRIIIQNLTELLKLGRSDNSLFHSLIAGVYVWISKQIECIEYCLIWNIEMEMLFERELHTNEIFLAFINSISYSINKHQNSPENGNLTDHHIIRIIDGNLSNEFLKILLKMIIKSLNRYHIIMKAIYDRFSSSISSNCEEYHINPVQRLQVHESFMKNSFISLLCC